MLNALTKITCSMIDTKVLKYKFGTVKLFELNLGNSKRVKTVITQCFHFIYLNHVVKKSGRALVDTDSLSKEDELCASFAASFGISGIVQADACCLLILISESAVFHSL